MSTAVDNSTLNLGFLTILQDNGTWLGGYLATNQWGRPLEFRLTSAVQPNRVQQILYGGTLEPYVCADLIGKTLVEKTPVPVGLVVTDAVAALELREFLDTPVAWVAHAQRVDDADAGTGDLLTDALTVRDNVYCHPRFGKDVAAINAILDKVIGVDLAEPFVRVRDAMNEARRMGIKK